MVMLLVPLVVNMQLRNKMEPKTELIDYDQDLH